MVGISVGVFCISSVEFPTEVNFHIVDYLFIYLFIFLLSLQFVWADIRIKSKRVKDIQGES